jgi:aspartyl-tRNA(Asn)/glutamyl-tRNA(Gln) amidotransferase subunit A
MASCSTTSTRSSPSTPGGMTDIPYWTMAAALELLASGDISAFELTQLVLDRIEDTEPLVHAYAYTSPEGALEAARLADRRRAAGDDLPLLGIPLAVKDNMETVDAPTEVGSRAMKGYRPSRDATVVERIRAAGAVILGKTVTHEFAYGLNTPPTRNPWRLDCFPGASSAGSAVAVAVGSAPAALGSDTAGSVRTPAAVNGIVGLKPTYGRVSRAGVFQASPSLDHVGFLARSVEDCALLLKVTAGSDPRDPCTIADVPEDSDLTLDRVPDLHGVRLGMERSYFFDYAEVQPGVREAVDAAISQLASLGAEVIEISIPELDLMSAVGSVINLADNSAWHRRLMRDKRSDYDPGTRRMLTLGAMIPAAAYANAHKARRLLSRAVREAFAANHLDALVGPTVPGVAHSLLTTPPLAPTPRLSPLVHHNYPGNLTGLPVLSLPCGFAEGLPVGLQIMGRPLAERQIMQIGLAFQRSTDWHTRRPQIKREEKPVD